MKDIEAIISKERETLETTLKQGVEVREFLSKYEPVLPQVDALLESLTDFRQFLAEVLTKAKKPMKPVDWERIHEAERKYKLSKKVYLLRFYPPETLSTLPLENRAAFMTSYFAQCMSKIEPCLHGIEIKSKQEYLLTAALMALEYRYLPMKQYLEKTHLGELVPDFSIRV